MLGKVLAAAIGITALGTIGYKQLMRSQKKSDKSEAKGKGDTKESAGAAGTDGPALSLSQYASVGYAVSPPNIALIKYFGKKSADLNTPSNSSYSLNFSMRTHRTTTLVLVDPLPPAGVTQEPDLLILNGKSSKLASRHHKMLKLVRQFSPPHLQGRVTIYTANNFATAAGLASSASGFCALGMALFAALEFAPQFPTHVQTIIRQGSGSACRSECDGGAEWFMGEREDGRDSVATSVHSQQHIDSMELVFLIVNISEAAKEISSTDGMTRVAATKYFPKRGVNALSNLTQLKKDISGANFGAMATIAIRDSNDMHYLAKEAEIVYGTATTDAVRGWVEKLNADSGRVLCGYTQDAGPNLVLIVQRKDVDAVTTAFVTQFRPNAIAPNRFVNDSLQILSAASSKAIAEGKGSAVDGVLGVTLSRPDVGAVSVPISAIRAALSCLTPAQVRLVLDYFAESPLSVLPALNL